MGKIIAGINITLDGFCDHTAMIGDDGLHQHYTDLLNKGGILLYGRITYQLMEDYWPTVVKNPTGNQAADDFAVAIENIPKVVFSRTLKDVKWKNVRLAKKDIKEEILDIRQQTDKDILVGSPSLIAALTRVNMFDEYQLCIHPVILGKGLPLFKDINDKAVLKLIKSKTLPSGQVALYYEPAR